MFPRLLLRIFQKRILGVPLTRISICSIALSVACALVVLSVMEGFEKKYLDSILGFNAHLVLIEEPNHPVTIPEELKSEIKSQTPFRTQEGLAGIHPILLKGVTPQSLTTVYQLDLKPNPHEINLAKNSVVLGKALYEQLYPDGHTGRPLTLLLQGDGTTSNLEKKFQVVGTFESGLYEFDQHFILTSLETMALLDISKQTMGIELKLKDPFQANHLAKVFSAETDIQAISWEELNQPLFTAMKMEKLLFFIILFLILMIACMNLAGVLFMVIHQRNRELVILHAMGLAKSQLIQLLVVFTLSVCGIAFGIGSGVAALSLAGLQLKGLQLDPEIYFLSRLPVSWSFSLWGIFLVLTLSLGYGVARATCYFIWKRNLRSP